MSDRIVLRDLRVSTRVGVGDEERSHPQGVLIDVTIEVDLSAAGASDDLTDTIDYAAVIDRVARLVEGAETRLLEHLAQRVADEMSGVEGAERVTVKIAKESPPVPEDIGEVAVEIERELR